MDDRCAGDGATSLSGCSNREGETRCDEVGATIIDGGGGGCIGIGATGNNDGCGGYKG